MFDIKVLVDSVNDMLVEDGSYKGYVLIEERGLLVEVDLEEGVKERVVEYCDIDWNKIEDREDWIGCVEFIFREGKKIK